MVSPLVSFAIIWGSITVASTLTVLAWRQRPQPGATAFATLMAAGTWWVATSSVGLFTVDVGRRLLLHRLEWAGIVVVPVAWLLFALEYTGRDEYVTKRNAVLLGVLPGVTLGIVWFADGGGLVYATRTVTVHGAVSIVEQTHGPWFWIHTAYAYALLGAGTLAVLRLAVSARPLYRGQALALLITVLAPWTGNLVFVAGYSPVPNLDITPFMFLISGATGIAALTQFDLLDAVPVSGRVARDAVVESMDDGVVVVDGDGRVIDVNPQAARVLDVDPSAALDRSLTDLLPVSGRLSADDPDARETVELDRPDGVRYYEVTASPIRDDRPVDGGAIVALHDVTERRNRIQQLDVLNRVLRHNLRNGMNVVYGHADRLDGDDADRIKEKATEMVRLGDKAREIDRILDGDDDGGPVDVDRVVEIEVNRAREAYPAATFETALSAAGARVSRPIGPVLRNLVENAVEHNDGDPHVTVTTSLADGALVLAVADDGPGLPEGERAVLRSRKETPLRHSSGLGLWLVSWGVETMGGSVSVDCPADGGTVVRLEIPLAGTPRAAGDPPRSSGRRDAR